MGGANERIIDQAPRTGGGQPRRRTGGDGESKLIQPGDPNRTTAPPLDAVGGPVSDANTPARALLIDLDAAALAIPGGRSGTPPGLGGQKVRCHKNKVDKRYHFHADEDGLKAVVPTADMWSAWNRLQHLGKFVYLDTENHTLLTITAFLDADPSSGGDRVHIAINIAPCKPTYSGEFDHLDFVVTNPE